MTVSRQHVAPSASSQSPRYLSKSQCPLNSVCPALCSLPLFTITNFAPISARVVSEREGDKISEPLKDPNDWCCKNHIKNKNLKQKLKIKNVYCTYIPNIVQHWINVSIFFCIKIIGKKAAFYWSYDDLHQLMFCRFTLFLFSEQQGKFHYYRKTPQMLLLISCNFWRLVVVFSSLLLSHSLSQEQSE